MHELLKMHQFLSIFVIEDSDVVLKKIANIVLQNDAKHKHERDFLMLIID